MENTRIKAERKCHRKVKTILREINVGIQNEIYLLCMFPAGVWLCTVDQWMSGAPLAFFYGGIFRAFCDLRQWEKRGSGGCDQGGHGGLDDREQENAQKEGWQTHIKRDERRGRGEWSCVRKEGVTLGGTTRKMAVLAVSGMNQLQYN